MRKSHLPLILLLATASTTWAGPTAAAETVTVAVNGLVCDFCARSIEKTLASHPGVHDVDVDLESRKVEIVMRPGKTLSDAAVRKGIIDAGFAVESIARSKS